MLFSFFKPRKLIALQQIHIRMFFLAPLYDHFKGFSGENVVV